MQGKVKRFKAKSKGIRAKCNCIALGYYLDDGFTGTNFKRPAFMRMMQDIEAGKADCVIVKDLSRFGRDYIETGKYLERYFPERNVRFISVTDNIDSGKQDYDMLLPIKNIFNEQYARDISQKVHSSIRAKQKAGEFIGAFAPYGYRKSPADKNRLIVDEYAAGVVRRIFRMYVGGLGKNRIAAEMNREGIVCPSEYKKLNGENYKNSRKPDNASYWTYSTVNRLLQNEMYVGNMVQGKKTQRMRGRQRATDRADWIIVRGTHEAIIDEDTWEKAQDLLNRRTRELNFNVNRSVFAGFLKCGDCGRALVKKVSASGRGKGSVHYCCGTYVRSGRQFCTPHRIPHPALEKIILEDLKTVLQNVDDLKEVIRKEQAKAKAKEGPEEREKKLLNAELGKVRKLKKAAYEDYREGLLSKEEYVAYRQDYFKKEEQLAKRLAGVEEEAFSQVKDAFELPWVKRLLELGRVAELDREIVVEMLQEIKVFEDHKIEITYRFSDELAEFFHRLAEF